MVWYPMLRLHHLARGIHLKSCNYYFRKEVLEMVLFEISQRIMCVIAAL